jgi:hypothetical protein
VALFHKHRAQRSGPRLFSPPSERRPALCRSPLQPFNLHVR